MIPRTILQKGRGRVRKLEALSYIYEKSGQYLGLVTEEAKDMAAAELQELGAEDISLIFRGITFRADRLALYRIVYHTRLLSRVLAPLIRFACPDPDTLYRESRKIRWEEFLTLRKTFAVESAVSGHPGFTHSNYAGLRVKDAIADYFRDRTDRRPNVDSKSPNLIVHVHIHGTEASLSVDLTGGSLHRRGYREMSVTAPMQETVAAAMIRWSGWDGSESLYDPMCGSGTLLAEALMAWCRVPSQIFRTGFGLVRLPDYDAALWDQVVQAGEQNIRPLPPWLIAGSDHAETSVTAARTNLMGIHHGGHVAISLMDFRDLPDFEDTVIVTNPPYGIRMGRDQDLRVFYRDLGQFLKTRCRGCRAFVYFGDPTYIRTVPIRPAATISLGLGGLDGKLVRYQM